MDFLLLKLEKETLKSKREIKDKKTLLEGYFTVGRLRGLNYNIETCILVPSAACWKVFLSAISRSTRGGRQGMLRVLRIPLTLPHTF